MSDFRGGADNKPSKTGATVRQDKDTSEAADGTRPAYRVLARKYRPASFADLIGQDALIRTLSNAIAGGRLAQAFMPSISRPVKNFAISS